MDVASGDMVITMDSDLQHPPRLIPEFVKYAEAGADIVIGERLSNKQHSFVREATGRMFYKFLSFVTGLDFKNVSDFALYKKSVVAILKRLPEKERFLRGMVQWVGFKKKYISYIVESRIYGQSKYSIKRLSGFVMNGVTSFSAFPLRLAFWVGLIIFVFSFGFSGYIAWDHYTNINPFNIGNATIIILILFLGSIQLMVLGVVGEYLYKMFNEVKGRPMYIVAGSNNLNEEWIRETQYGMHSK
jgi:dolichol-phosphate mannosyltransferase